MPSSSLSVKDYFEHEGANGLTLKHEALLEKKSSQITNAPALITRAVNQFGQNCKGNRDRDPLRCFLQGADRALLRRDLVHGCGGW